MSKDEKLVKAKATKPSKQKVEEIKIFNPSGTINQTTKENK